MQEDIKQEVLGRTDSLISLVTTRTVWETTRATIILLLHVFVEAVKFLPSRCLATIMEYIYRHRLIGGIYEERR
jgi:hypothetical protein